MTSAAQILATWFGVGLMPKAPGTFGALAALPLAWLIVLGSGRTGLLAATLLAFAIGWWAADVYATRAGSHDPGAVVIDEVAGQWLTLVAVPLTLPGYALGFVLFRVFDIVKPWPVSWADRSVGGGLGIMLDDVLAGLYAAAALIGLRLMGVPL